MIVLGAIVTKELYPRHYRIELTVDRLPDRAELRYTKKDNLYWAEKDGYVSFFSWRGPHNEEGYGGAEIPVTMKDTEQVVILKGPWSSNAGYANMLKFPSSIEVIIHEEWWPASKWAGAITVELANYALDKFAPQYKVSKYPHNGTYRVVRRGL